MLFLADVIGAITLLFVILILLFFIYRNEGLHKNKAMHIYLMQASAVFSIIFYAAVFLQVLSYNRDQEIQTVKEYEDIAKEFFNDTINIFIENPDLGYYFEHLFNDTPISPDTIRHLRREREITYLILSKLGTIVSYEDIMAPKSKALLDEWITKIMSNFVKSPIFVQYWEDYKNTFGGYLSSKFMKKHFNL